VKVREFMNGVQETLDKQFPKELGKILLGIVRRIPAGERKTLFAWCRGRVEERVTEIVKMKYRKSYRKASILAVAIAELINDLEGEDSALNCLVGWRTTFNRHTAFRNELRNCTAAFSLPSSGVISKKM